MPDFKPLHIEDFDDYSTLNLPLNLNIYDLLAIFKLFFTNNIIDKLTEWTNKYVELYPAEEEAEFIYK